MTISEIKKWAKDHGFEIVKQKDDSVNGSSYYWSNSTTNASGVSQSVSKVARDIFNVMTNNKWISHQQDFQEKLESEKYVTI